MDMSTGKAEPVEVEEKIDAENEEMEPPPTAMPFFVLFACAVDFVFARRIQNSEVCVLWEREEAPAKPRTTVANRRSSSPVADVVDPNPVPEPPRRRRLPASGEGPCTDANHRRKPCPFRIDDPSNDQGVSGDPYKTLFVARLNYDTTESRIKREFEVYGPIKRVSDKGTKLGVAGLKHFNLFPEEKWYFKFSSRELKSR
ncbi:hypothetical protein ACS0TY_020932 [Phlomoides rotata]